LKNFYVDIIQGRGSYYELGLLAGRLHKDSTLYTHHLKRRVSSLRNYKIDIKKAELLFHQFAPQLWDELIGLSEGMNWPLNEAVHEYSGYQADWNKSGCSVMIQNGYFVRNYDYHPKTYEGRFLFWAPTTGYASIGFATRMIGRMDGMNEKGLVVAYNFVNRLRAEEGVICCTIARFILDTCSTTIEAIQLLRRIPHRHSFNYSLYDRNGHAAVVEASPRGIYVHEGPSIVCTNHFISDELKQENRYHLDESLNRKRALKQSQDKIILSSIEAFKLFNNSTGPIFKKDYHNWAGTLHTIVYIPKTLKVIVGIGSDCKPMIFSFQEWLDGKKGLVKKLRGRIKE
jgi:predicted choloylglycine hydrolase